MCHAFDIIAFRLRRVISLNQKDVNAMGLDIELAGPRKNWKGK